MKRILSLVLAMLMIISLTACNSNPSSTDKETKKIIDAAGDEVIIPAKVDTVINLVTYGCQVMLFQIGLIQCSLLKRSRGISMAW